MALVGHEAAERARSEERRLAAAPVVLRGQLVHGQVLDADGTPHTVSVGRSPAGELACRCSCTAFDRTPPCVHVAWLLLALASSPPMRERLLATQPKSHAAARHSAAPANGAGGSAAPAGPDLPRALALAREAGVDLDAGRAERRTGAGDLLETTFQGWRRRGPLRPLGDCTFFVGVEPADPDEVDSSPTLRVRIQPLAERRPFGPDELEARRLPAAEWRLLEPLVRSRGPDRHFLACGPAATVFLDRAAEAGLELRDESGTRTLTLLRHALRPGFRLRDAHPGEVEGHPLIAARCADAALQEERLRTAWQRYRAEVAPIPERQFRDLLGWVAREREAGGELARALDAAWLPTTTGSATQDVDDVPREPVVAFADSILLLGPRSWVFLPSAGSFARVARDVGPIALARLAAQPTLLLAAPEVAGLPALLRETFRSEGVRLPSREELGLAPLPVPHVVLRLTGSAFTAHARLEAIYPTGRVPLTPGSCADPDDPTRNAEIERAALDLLEGTALARKEGGRRRNAPTVTSEEAKPEEEAGEGWAAEGDRAVTFWIRELPSLVRQACPAGPIHEIVVPPALRQLAVRAPVRASLGARANRSEVIEVALRYASDGAEVDVEEIRQALAAKRRWVRLTDGNVAEISDRVAALAAATREALRRTTRAELPRWALGEIEAWRELADSSDLDDLVAGWTERLRSGPAHAGLQPPTGLHATLRSYQEAGVAWLQLLAELHVGGVLADDMGLGKTLQTLALLLWRRERDAPAPSLVVAPTSVALNWIREAERFAPSLRALLLHGADRHERYDEVPRFDLVVTTYALLRRDVARLRAVRFRYVVLDEAQQIKNHAAATTAAAKSLHAEARLALTGTPIENRLLELWSILDFCNPGMLGSWRSFARRYERPLVQTLGEATDSAEAAALRARIRPFVLRRTKAEVQRDLPPKIESDVVVELTPAQRRAYAALAAATRADLEPRLAGDGFERHRMRILTALLRLRQMACDPRLVDPRHGPEDSAKLLALRELVSEVIEGGRRALVFSQFVELLGLLRQDLDAQGIEYAYLDGRTRDRQAVLDRFTRGTMPLFLLSLRAGGTGINLAAADVVIHLDPWWNPAVEDQATDRAHRIGQERTVSVYRIVAAGTIEEAILRLKERKRTLASSVIDSSDAELAQLSDSDIAELLRFSA